MRIETIYLVVTFYVLESKIHYKSFESLDEAKTYADSNNLNGYMASGVTDIILYKNI
jgi:hypothetical protein